MANSSEEELKLRRGPWTLEEDTLLIHYITSHGEGRWNFLANSSGLKRTGKSCRLRWLNYLKPDTKRGNLTPQEQLRILELHSEWGNRWSKIAQHLPGRTDNEIKNYWRTRVQKQARQLKIDSNSTKFLETLRHFWKPRLLEKVEQNSASTSTSSSSVSSISTTEIQINQSPFPETKQPLMTTLLEITAEERKGLGEFFLDDRKYRDYMGNSASQTSPTTEYQANGNIPYNNSVPEDCYTVDISSFDMEGYQQDMSSVGSHPTLLSECQMAEADWFGGDLQGTFWNMDEKWQFRE